MNEPNKPKRQLLLDWLLGPDLELILSQRTRLSMLVLSVSLTGVIVFFDYTEADLPLNLIPAVLATIATLSFGHLYFRSDELIRDHLKNAAVISIPLSLLAGVIYRTLPIGSTGMLSVDTALLILFLHYLFWVMVLYRLKL